MKECVADAIVLSLVPSRETDRTVFLFTKEWGKIAARVVAGAKPLSKFSPHLDPGNLVTVRLTLKNGYTLTDVLTKERFGAIREGESSMKRMLRALFVIDHLMPEAVPDEDLWGALLSLMHGEKGVPDEMLVRMGYDVRHARCAVCGNAKPEFFSVGTHEFLCLRCSVPFPENTLLLMEE